MRTIPFAILCLLASATAAQQPRDGVPSAPAPYTPPCAGPVRWAETNSTFTDFDFWVGQWQVFDRETGLMMGFDEVRKVFDGCVLEQHWRQFNDRFTLRGSPVRLEGGSRTALGADGRWHQTWLDNNGGNIPLAGGLEADGTMVLESDWLEFIGRDGQPARLKYRWHWRPQPDGTIHNWGLTASESRDEPQWRKTFDILYRKNVPGGPRAQAVPEREGS